MLTLIYDIYIIKMYNNNLRYTRHYIINYSTVTTIINIYNYYNIRYIYIIHIMYICGKYKLYTP